jgi:hypothetical protein
VPTSDDFLSQLKSAVRRIGGKYEDRFHRARRLFVEERPAALAQWRETEYEIKTEISEYFGTDYSAICFSGSSQLGFSIHKDKLFELATSDPDVACVDAGLYNRAWSEIITCTKAFTDLTPFSGRGADKTLRDNIVRRGMIGVQLMPRSALSAIGKILKVVLAENIRICLEAYR